MNGILVTLEGCEGCGKTTQADILAEHLRNAGHKVIRVREPGGTRTGELMREVLQHDKAGEPLFKETETFLFLASRAQLVRQVILPALEAGDCVVCDRFIDSTTAYQGFARGQDVEEVIRMNLFAVGAALPDITILLDIDVKKGFERVQNRYLASGGQQDRIEGEGLIFHQKVRDGYLALAQRWPERFRVISADRDKDAVSAEILALFEPVLQRKKFPG